MNRGTPRSIMSESNKLDSSLRRRSPRLSPALQANLKMAPASVAVKRSITVRKIAPRKTAAPSEHNKENTPRRPESGGSEQKKHKVSTPGPVPRRGRSSCSAEGEKTKEKAAMPSPILPSSPPPSCAQLPAAAAAPGDAVWSQRVRRSYSRLGDKSLNSPDSRDTLFGFEMLQTPEVARRGPGAPGPLSCLDSFASLLDADDCGPAVPAQDPHIPGVVVVKERRRRRRKAPQMGTTELDALAAEMNAVFEEAAEFELVVE